LNIPTGSWSATELSKLMHVSRNTLLTILAIITAAVLAPLIAWFIAAREPINATTPPLIFPAELAVPAIATQSSNITPPQIVLYGTFVNDAIRIALLSTDNDPQRWLESGQNINNDFYIDGVFSDHIIVRDIGRTLLLKIKITNMVSDAPTLSVAPVRAKPAHTDVTNYPPVPGIDHIESNHYRIDRELLNKELNSGEIFRQIRIVPDEDGGFFIKSIKSGSLPEIIGLHVGDIIHKVNNKPLTSITDVLDLYKQLDTMKKVDVEINRTHKLQQLHYDLE
jgi:type II secretory pathway component PulC